MLDTEQFAATTKGNLEVLMGLTARAFEGVEQLTLLNLQVMKTGLGGARETALAALSVQDPYALLALQAGLLRPDNATTGSVVKAGGKAKRG